MKKLIVLALLSMPACALAQGVAVGADVGTSGLGGQLIFGLRDNLNLRLGANGIDFNHSYGHHGVDYDSSVKLFNAPLVVDWFPARSAFRLSAGVAFSQNKIDAEGRPQSGVYTIGDNTYSATQIGSVRGESKYNAIAPYLGVGWGNPVAPQKHFGWNVDVGLLYLGRPKTTYTVVCGTGVNCAQLQNDASIEAGNFDHDLQKYRFFPLAQFYLTWRF